MELRKGSLYKVEYRSIEGVEKFTGRYEGMGEGMGDNALFFKGDSENLFASVEDLVKTEKLID